jgi:hypothetical protein
MGKNVEFKYYSKFEFIFEVRGPGRFFPCKKTRSHPEIAVGQFS